jgi:hypothetical protein
MHQCTEVCYGRTWKMHFLLVAAHIILLELSLLCYVSSCPELGGLLALSETLSQLLDVDAIEEALHIY